MASAPACAADRLDAVLWVVRGGATSRPLCRHCSGSRIQRWGRFRGRQRYHCVTCERTFSDFTSTPLANLKRPELWKDFCGCMVEGVSVREAAERVGVHKDTAFRWRHRLLRTLCGQGSPPLRGLVDVDTLYFRYSEKGSRTPSRREPHTRRFWFQPMSTEERERVYVLLTRDRLGATVAKVACWGRPTSNELEEVLRPLVSGVRGLVSAAGRFSRYGVVCKRMGVAFHCARAGGSAGREEAPQHKENIGGYRRRLRRWLRRFRGVATKYLDHYLRWHTWLEVGGVGSVETAARRLLGVVTRAARSPMLDPAGKAGLPRAC